MNKIFPPYYVGIFRDNRKSGFTYLITNEFYEHQSYDVRKSQ